MFSNKISPRNNMTSDSSDDSNDRIWNTYSINNSSNKISKGNNSSASKSQIILKLHNISSSLSDIVLEKKNRHEYEDLDTIQQVKRLNNTTTTPSLITKIFFQNFNETSCKYQISHSNKNLVKNVSDVNNDNFTSIKNDSFIPSDILNYHNNDVILKKSTVIQRRNNKNILLTIYVCFYVLFLLLGGLTFHFFEEAIEYKIREEFRSTRSEFKLKYPAIEDDDLENFLTEVIRANDRGISPLHNASNESNWSFGQALFFASTVVTTIGYGHVTPLSQTGKIFCMIYATFGIPFTLVLLTAVVERLLIPANWLLGSLNTKLGHLYDPLNIRLLHLFIISIIAGVLFFAIPTVIFTYLEPSWDVLDAFYYCFISMTTVGLGDYIPGEGVSTDNRSLYKIFITIYLITGLMGVMLVLTVFYDIPQLNLGQLFTEDSTAETKKFRLRGNTADLYIPQRNEDTRRAVVRIRPHGDETLSPDEQPSSLHEKLRIS